jgi:hypothetical protein
MISGYSSDQFQAFAIDVWDGGDLSAEIFLANANITYPYLMLGGINGIMTSYQCQYDIVFVIGGDGIIIYRGEYADGAPVQAAIDQGIAELDGTSAVGDIPATKHRLLDGYPNPFNPRTSIPYELAAGSGTGTERVSLQILDLRGRVVKTLVDGTKAVGQRYEAVWDGTDAAGRRMPSGAYMSRLTVGGESQAKLLTLVK